MQLGPLKIVSGTGEKFGIWKRNANGSEQDVTVPAIAVAVGLVVVLLCCCGWMF